MRNVAVIVAIFSLAAVLDLSISIWCLSSSWRELLSSPAHLAAAVLPAALIAVGVGAWLRLEYATLPQCAHGERGRAGKRRLFAPLARHWRQWRQGSETGWRAGREYLADMAHELRRPLTLMRAEIAAVRDGLRRADTAFLARLELDLLDLMLLTDSLAQLGSHEPARQRAPLHLEACIRQVIERFRLALQSKNQSFLLSYDTDCRMWGDPYGLSQLFSNLMSNSIRHTDTGGRLQIRVQRREDGLAVQWDDSGPGVCDADLPRLAQRGFRAGTRSPGSGRGLSIAKTIVESHEGSMKFAHSELGGLSVQLHFPHTVSP